MKLVFSILWCAIIVLATPVYLAAMGILFCGAATFHWMMRPVRTHRILTKMQLRTSN